jgi:uncharacterized protein YndB with AHSA1/START domain
MTLEPIRKHVDVPIGPDEAFRLFTAGMGSWWPLDTHSRREDDQVVKDVVVEEHVGGRIYELMTDGSEGYWGTVTAWEPPSRLVVDWRPNDQIEQPHTEVEVRFSPAADGGTSVDLEHRNWERLGERAEEGRAQYDSDSGWVLVLETAFVEAAGRA